ncbi:NADP-dependent oxidoreductase [Dactylosporangium darangshiense]|uniref:NADP-dependent oxidoreductase n=1 Tax=Dactylosporangium darangshiense TaxID=579108 RepID=A0ABP8DK45_9ACTN
MKALRAHVRGGAEQLVFEDAPRPVPGPGDALVAVRAAAITLAELDWDLSWQTRDGADRTPVVPSHEVSGVVEALGEGVSGPEVGQEVYGLIDFDRDGAAAQYVTVPAADLATKPATVPHVEAATLPLAALTAWQALVDQAAVQPGERVFVRGAAGGVGVYLVQLAAGLDAHVIASSRPQDEAYVRDLGADEFSDAGDLRGSIDVAIDTVGGPFIPASIDLLRPGGRLVTLAEPAPPGLAEAHDVRALFFVVRPDRAELTHLAALVDAGRLRPVVSQTFPLEQGRAAYESGAHPRRPGKIVLTVG